jgi:hypothetical protein
VAADLGPARTLGSMLSVPVTAPGLGGSRPALVRAACPQARPQAECGFLRVPLYRRFPHGRSIRIYFEHYLRAQRSGDPSVQRSGRSQV